jgi:hypothetical protein
LEGALSVPLLTLPLLIMVNAAELFVIELLTFMVAVSTVIGRSSDMSLPLTFSVPEPAMTMPGSAPVPVEAPKAAAERGGVVDGDSRAVWAAFEDRRQTLELDAGALEDLSGSLRRAGRPD